MAKSLRARLRDVLLAGGQRVLGDPTRLGDRILRLVLLLSAMGGAAALWYLLIRDVDATRSSYGVMAPLVQFATSTWSYVLLELLLLRGILRITNSRRARQAAAHTGMDKQDVQLLAAEAKTFRDATRVISTSEDTEEETEERLQRGFSAGESNVIRRNTRDEELPQVHPSEIEREYPTLLGVLKFPLYLIAAVAIPAAAAWELAPGLVLAAVGELPFALPPLRFLALGSGITLGILLGGPLGYYLLRRYHHMRELTEGAGEESSESEPLSWGEQFKLARMDLAASLESQELIWQFTVPALLAAGALIIMSGIWLQWWAYPLILAAGVFVGALNYARIRRSRRRELAALRSSGERGSWSACSVLIKSVQTDSTPMYYARIAGRGFAHYDSEELAAALAPRIHQLLRGEEMEPSVMEKYYRNLRDHYPDIDGWRRNVEEYKIQSELIQRVDESPDGILPLAMLIEDVVLHDIESRLWGLTRSGYGYDPELVRECYQELSPYALVEEEMEIPTPAGEMKEVRAVRIRTQPLPAELSEVRARFESRFRSYAQWEPLYQLPEEPPTTHPEAVA